VLRWPWESRLVQVLRSRLELGSRVLLLRSRSARGWVLASRLRLGSRSRWVSRLELG